MAVAPACTGALITVSVALSVTLSKILPNTFSSIVVNSLSNAFPIPVADNAFSNTCSSARVSRV